MSHTNFILSRRCAFYFKSGKPMSNVDILGTSKYRPIKYRLGDQFNPLNQLKSQQSSTPLIYKDLIYESDVVDENLTNYEGYTN
jgi:hypothetical protein